MFLPKTDLNHDGIEQKGITCINFTFPVFNGIQSNSNKKKTFMLEKINKSKELFVKIK